MKERRPSREERRQREKEELSRQKLQEQAFLETQRNVFARIKRGEDYWDGGTSENWNRPPAYRGEARRYSPDDRYYPDEWEYPPENGYYRDEREYPPEDRYYRDEREYSPEDRYYRDERDYSPDDRYYPDEWEYPPEERCYRDERNYPPEDRDYPPDRRDAPEEQDTAPIRQEYSEEDWKEGNLNPAILNMKWDSPEEQEAPKRGKKKAVLIIVLLLAVLLAAVAAVHLFWVRAPELPGGVDEGIPPSLMEAGRREGVYTFLLVGRDDAGGGNTDTIMVGCFDTVNGTADVLSIFRDTLVDVPWDIKKINSVYNVQGLEGLQKQVKNLIGYTPDYYFVVEMNAVAELVDAIGGVDYDVPYNMDYDDPTQDLHIHFQKGPQHLNGEDAVKVLRWRKNNSGENLSVGDVGRVEIQHDFLNSLAREMLSLGNVTKVRQLARIVDDNLDSDLSYGEMFWFGEKALGLQEGGLRFHSLPGDYGGTMWSQTYHNYQSYVFVNNSELLDIVNQYMNPYLEDIPAESQHILNGTTVSSQTVLP